jgi:peroxiredoxin
MQKLAKEKRYSFPYLYDETQEVAKAFGATKTPHVFLLENKNNSFTVQYIGAIDDNADDAKAVTVKYVEKAIQQLGDGREPDPSVTKAIGCTIKWKKAAE